MSLRWFMKPMEMAIKNSEDRFVLNPFYFPPDFEKHLSQMMSKQSV